MNGRAGGGLLLGLLFAAATSSAPDEIELKISQKGFTPRELTLRRGEPVRLLLHSEDGEHCFALDSQRIEKRVRPGKPTVVEFSPARVGRQRFYCCIHSEGSPQEAGQIVVGE